MDKNIRYVREKRVALLLNEMVLHLLSVKPDEPIEGLLQYMRHHFPDDAKAVGLGVEEEEQGQEEQAEGQKKTEQQEEPKLPTPPPTEDGASFKGHRAVSPTDAISTEATSRWAQEDAKVNNDMVRLLLSLKEKEHHTLDALLALQKGKGVHPTAPLSEDEIADGEKDAKIMLDVISILSDGRVDTRYVPPQQPKQPEQEEGKGDAVTQEAAQEEENLNLLPLPEIENKASALVGKIVRQHNASVVKRVLAMHEDMDDEDEEVDEEGDEGEDDHHQKPSATGGRSGEFSLGIVAADVHNTFTEDAMETIMEPMALLEELSKNELEFLSQLESAKNSESTSQEDRQLIAEAEQSSLDTLSTAAAMNTTISSLVGAWHKEQAPSAAQADVILAQLLANELQFISSMKTTRKALEASGKTQEAHYVNEALDSSKQMVSSLEEMNHTQLEANIFLVSLTNHLSPAEISSYRALALLGRLSNDTQSLTRGLNHASAVVRHRPLSVSASASLGDSTAPTSLSFDYDGDEQEIAAAIDQALGVQDDLQELLKVSEQHQLALDSIASSTSTAPTREGKGVLTTHFTTASSSSRALSVGRIPEVVTLASAASEVTSRKRSSNEDGTERGVFDVFNLVLVETLRTVGSAFECTLTVANKSTLSLIHVAIARAALYHQEGSSGSAAAVEKAHRQAAEALLTLLAQRCLASDRLLNDEKNPQVKYIFQHYSNTIRSFLAVFS